MALIPDRAVNLTMASLSINSAMAAYWADLSNSAWSGALQTPITAGPDGSFAQAVESASGNTELSLLNNGTVASPSDQIRLGVNPDGSSDPIVDPLLQHHNQIGPITAGVTFTDGGGGDDVLTRLDALTWISAGFVVGSTVTVANANNPANDGTYTITNESGATLYVTTGSLTADVGDTSATFDTQPGASNFSGIDGGYLQATLVPQHVQFIVLEWPDALMFLFKNASRTTMTHGFHFGKILKPVIPAAESVGAIRLDGHAMFLTGVHASTNGWFDPSANKLRRRIGTGCINQPSTTLASWSDLGNMTMSGGVSAGNSGTGPLDERIPRAYSYYATTSPEVYVMKYIRAMEAEIDPFDTWKVAGTPRYMVLGNAASPWSSCVAIPAAFNPNP